MTATDARDRELIRSALDETLVVEAAAGTGKTTALVDRMVRVLATGRAEMSGLVAVTFTEKAAGELKLRLRQELEKARAVEPRPADERAALEAALRSLEEAQIGTIHGFCADLLKEHPVEAGIDPLFVVLTEDQARRRYDDAFNAWFQSALRDMPEGVRRSLRRSSRPGMGGDGDADGPVDRLRAAGWNLSEWRDFPSPWTRPEFERASEIDRLTTCVQLFAEITRKASNLRDTLFLDTASARRAADELPRLITDGDLDGAEALLVDLCRDRDFRRARKGYGPQFAKEFSRVATYEAHQELVAQLDQFRMDADADLAALLRDELRGSLDLYADLKRRRGELDFFDLLHCARNLVVERADVRASLQRAARGSSWTSSRTPTRCRRSCCSCSRPTTPTSATGGRCARCQASCSSSATRSSRSTASAGPTSACTTTSAINCSGTARAISRWRRASAARRRCSRW